LDQFGFEGGFIEFGGVGESGGLVVGGGFDVFDCEGGGILLEGLEGCSKELSGDGECNDEEGDGYCESGEWDGAGCGFGLFRLAFWRHPTPAPPLKGRDVGAGCGLGLFWGVGHSVISLS
jgi:hypothetical protein